MKRPLLPILMLLALGPAAAHAAGPHGLQPGWVIDDAAPINNILFTDETAQRLTDAGAGWMRLNFRLARHADWDATLLSRYDVVVDTARRHGLQIVALVGHEAHNGGQSDWEENARETGGGRAGADGSNAYMDGLAESAIVLMKHFRGRIRYWELWNEPNAWTVNYGEGGPFIYPSNFAYYLGRTYSRAREEGLSPDVRIVSGGLFAHDIGGRDRAHATANDYIPATFQAGKRLGEGQSPLPAWNWQAIRARYGTYPVDAFGYHVYLDDNAADHATDTTSVGQYLDWFRESFRSSSAEGAGSQKTVFLTEIGYHTPPSNDAATWAATLANQATSVDRAMSQIKARPWVQTAVFFQDLDNPAGGLLYGMYRADGSPKPARDHLRDQCTYEGRRRDGTVDDRILAYYTARGQGQMGSPCDVGRGPYVAPFVDGSAAQDFDGGTIGAQRLVASSQGAFAVSGRLRDAYVAAGAADALGVPVREALAFAGGTRQDFRRGFLFESGGRVTRHLYGDVDGDGLIGFADAAACLRIAAGFSFPYGAQADRADVAPAGPEPGVPGDGRVGVPDALRIAARALTGASPDWP